MLKGNYFTPFYVDMQLDVWRYIVRDKGDASTHQGHLLDKEEFCRLKFLPNNWWYFTDANGEGTAIEFPVKVKPVLSWSPKTHILQRLPRERLKRFLVKRPYSFVLENGII